MTFEPEFAARVLALLGMVIELAGVVLTADEYLQLSIWDKVKSLIFVLWKDKSVIDTVLTSKDLGGERPEQSIQGIGLICLGIVLHIVGGIVELGAHPPFTAPLAQLEHRSGPATGRHSSQNQREPARVLGEGDVKK